jgi:hypothetical protein
MKTMHSVIDEKKSSYSSNQKHCQPITNPIELDWHSLENQFAATWAERR